MQQSMPRRIHALCVSMIMSVLMLAMPGASLIVSAQTSNAPQEARTPIQLVALLYAVGREWVLAAKQRRA